MHILGKAIQSVREIALVLQGVKESDMRVFSAMKGALELLVNGCSGQGLHANQHR
jgi:hypothetical protein